MSNNKKKYYVDENLDDKIIKLLPLLDKIFENTTIEKKFDIPTNEKYLYSFTEIYYNKDIKGNYPGDTQGRMNTLEQLPLVYSYGETELNKFIKADYNNNIIELLRTHKTLFNIHEDKYKYNQIYINRIIQEVINKIKNSKDPDEQYLLYYLQENATQNSWYKSDTFTINQKYEFLKNIAAYKPIQGEEYIIENKLKAYLKSLTLFSNSDFETIKNKRDYMELYKRSGIINASNTVKHKYLKYKQKYLHLKQKIDLQ